MVFDVYVFGFWCWLLGFGGGDLADVVDMEGGWDGGAEGVEVVKEFPQTVRVFGYVEGRYVLCLPRG